MDRNQVNERYKWKTEDIFATDEDWEKTFETLQNSVNFSKYSGKLNNKETLLEFFMANDKFNFDLIRVYVYAHMRHDEDAGISKYNS